VSGGGGENRRTGRGQMGWRDRSDLGSQGEGGDGDGFDDLEDSGPRTRRALLDRLPDPRDGLTRVERVVLWQLDRLEGERRGRDVPTIQLFGWVLEHVPDLSEGELQSVLQRLGARRGDG